MMDDEVTLAQESMRWLEPKSAIDVASCSSSMVFDYSWDMRLNSASKWLMNDEQASRNRVLWQFFRKKSSMSKNEKVREQRVFLFW